MKTKSEEAFEYFLTLNNIPFKKIDEVNEKGSYRPDYQAQIGNFELIFEVKELTGAFRGVPGIHVGSAIKGSHDQIRYGTVRGLPSVLLICSLIDGGAGTDDLDFTTAMYGELTAYIDKNTGESSQFVHARNDHLQEKKNTSFSAVGRLAFDLFGKPMVTLFENVYSKVPVPYEQLPPCFVVNRINVSRTPLSFA